ncbi:uncharacterized protein LOC112056832 [Bicyclus anynana]|uniref:Uncharacterized protein LOC112056832 n=1 Tax=Bicyclus anynana TaxID=110368 RepID=A0A6J1P5H6_BICAN|nr:uncharacterized protein LOC112056832 [Bicyclus anynana]
MAFSLRKMFSNITYFKKPDESSDHNTRRNMYAVDEPFIVNYDNTEPDSTSRQCTSLNLPETVRNFADKKCSLSDTDLLNTKFQTSIRKKRKCKKLKLDIKKASQSMNELTEDGNVENTPKHVHLEPKSSDIFSEKFRTLDFNKTFNLIDAMSEDCQSSSPFEEDFDIESLTEHSDSDTSAPTNKSPVKMCRKVTESQCSDDDQIAPSLSIESFTDIELEKDEDERMKLLVNYQSKLEKLECFTKKLLKEFQFHIEVSKVFNSRSSAPSNIENIPKMLNKFMYTNSNMNTPNLSDSWNVILDKEDNETKDKVKKHLLSMKRFIDEFVCLNLQNAENSDAESKTQSRPVKKCQRYVPRHLSRKKKIKHFDFPDLREAMLNLFNIDNSTTQDITTDLSSSDESDMSKCVCKCHNTSSETDSGATSTVNDQSMSITSSIGNFTLDISELTAYSESLDHIVSCSSFEDTSFYATLLQKSAIERISFYIQVHSIQLKSEPDEFQTKNTLTFHCPPCKDVQIEEKGLLKHILSQSHCEKIHFLYKTAYIKKCVAAGKEIQPSTVLNPMTMYRDENKIVCFGDALYACSLCFENLIVGESILMTHCCEPQHIERKERLAEMRSIVSEICN